MIDNLARPARSRGDEQLRRGLSLFERNDRLGAFDAVLAATALDAGASALVSANGAFASVAGLPHVVPDGEGVETLLSEQAG